MTVSPRLTWCLIALLVGATLLILRREIHSRQQNRQLESLREEKRLLSDERAELAAKWLRVRDFLTSDEPDASAPAVQPGFLGANFRSNRSGWGAIVDYVLPHTAGAVAKLRPGDEIISINGQAIKDERELTELIERMGGGTATDLVVLRDQILILVPITLDDRPAYMWQAGENPMRADEFRFHFAGGRFLGNYNSGDDTVVERDVTVHGNFTQRWSGRLKLIINSGDASAAVDVAGDVTLAGILEVELQDWPLSEGGHFEFIRNAHSLRGHFGMLNLPDPGRGLRWQIIYDDIAKGIDFDHDGKHDVTLVVIKDGTSVRDFREPTPASR